MVGRKCDRCRTMYSLNLDDKTPEPNGYGGFNSIATIDISECIANSKRQHTYYLCPHCRKDFNKWFEEGLYANESELEKLL